MRQRYPYTHLSRSLHSPMLTSSRSLKGPIFFLKEAIFSLEIDNVAGAGRDEESGCRRVDRGLQSTLGASLIAEGSRGGNIIAMWQPRADAEGLEDCPRPPGRGR